MGVGGIVVVTCDNCDANMDIDYNGAHWIAIDDAEEQGWVFLDDDGEACHCPKCHRKLTNAEPEAKIVTVAFVAAVQLAEREQPWLIPVVVTGSETKLKSHEFHLAVESYIKNDFIPASDILIFAEDKSSSVMNVFTMEQWQVAQRIDLTKE